MQHAVELQGLDVVMPIVIAVVFIFIMSLVKEPARQQFNAVFVGGAAAAYLSSGLGHWEFVFTTVATAFAYLGLRSYRYIGIAWLLHSGWDLVHHFYADPIVLSQPTSSFGCAITDTLIAVWFFYGAPSLWRRFRPDPALG